jgi:outer membrane protein OmpA-like peptidoglycan-associated protein
MRLNLLWLIVGFWLNFSNAFGQHLLGMANSNYAGTNGLYLNPASIADSRHSFYVNFFTVDAHIANNRFSWQGPNFPSWLINGDEFREEYLKERPSGNRFSAGAEVRGPALLARINPNNSLALSTRSRVLVSGNNISSNIFSLIRTGIDEDDLLNQTFNNTGFNLNANVVNEYALTYARAVLNKDQHYLKAGITLKYLRGIYSAQLNAQTLDYQIQTNPSIPSQNIFRINQLRGQGAYSTDTPLEDLDWADAVLGRGNLGSGLGFDLGVVYENRPDDSEYTYTMDNETQIDHRKNKYKYRVGLSLLDIGGVRYNLNGTRLYAVNVQNRSLTESQVEELSDPEQTLQNLGIDLNNFENKFRASLPSTVNLSLDYALAKELYANLTVIQSLRPKNALGARYNSMLALTPRFESGGFEVALPLCLNTNYSNFAVGFAMKLGSLRFGSDDLAAIIGLKNTSGANFYVGLGFGIYNKKRVKDSDGDGVSDQSDECPDSKGLPQFKGCPDTDEDGIPDKLDSCATEAGKPEFQGCPDSDNDGIQDKDDVCPNKPGKAEFKGCPDSDEDGIEDKDDLCPQVAGKPEFKGCPDSDNDGIEDKNDECPQEAGTKAMNGCPDTDGDGIKDKEDACPKEAGLTAFYGCPDTDKDGIPDRNDACPEVPGLKINNGCPEVKSNEPVLTEEEKEVLKEAFENLEFELGKSVITKSSFTSLDELADVLKKRTTYRLQISGHTDNVGNAQTNLQLSKDRANAVKNYLVKKGIAATRLVAQGFGSSKPVADNRTQEGRQKNRRVEMKVIK